MSEKLLNHRKALTNRVKRIAEEAGALILEYFDGMRENEITDKSDGSPVTQADQAAESLIETRLAEILPDIPMIGEEKHAAGQHPDVSNREYFWLVDALDGTRAFIKGQGEFTVNIALIHKNAPVLGVIYAPEKGELYTGYIDPDGQGEAIRYNEDTDTEKSIHARKMPNKGLIITIGGSHAQEEKLSALLEAIKVEKITRQSSSLKLCAIASGKADLYPRFGEICEWDIAAGHAILRAAGADVRQTSGESLQYFGKNDEIHLPNFIAASTAFFEAMK